MKLIIFCPFRRDFSLKSGSNVRIRGYTEYLIENFKDILFMAPVRPDYVAESKFSCFPLPDRIKKLFLLHNVFYNSAASRPLSYFLWKNLMRYKPVKYLIKVAINNSIIISHQDNSIALFLKIRYDIDVIYDIHGILRLQMEYLQGMNLWKRIWFLISLINEKLTFSKIKYVNSINNEMTRYLINEMGFKGHAFLVPDGFLKLYNADDKSCRDLKEYKYSLSLNDRDIIILFFGSFKKIGGVHILAESFCDMARENDNLKLILIGDGQMKGLIQRRIEEEKLSERVKFIKEVPYEELHAFIQIASVIVIPDTTNMYNRLIPHIKTYDAMLSGRPILISDFSVNRDLMNEIKYPFVFFKPSDTVDLKAKLSTLLLNKPTKINKKNTQFLNFTYRHHARSLLIQYNKSGILN